MYEPPHFVEDRAPVMLDLIRTHPLGLLICNGENGPVANPVPFLVESAETGVVLRAHLARANGQWKLLEEAPAALAVFQGPQSYVTPSWYATKAETGKVVPTWNYCIVQARGTAKVHHDPQWLAGQVGALT
ncbi:MAG: FMN-binding negative transcriptional regulator, partial [Nitratireductor sp.]|nr:FMN-binding negative transcriptional regulator [Nitratireductor sp.]